MSPIDTIRTHASRLGFTMLGVAGVAFAAWRVTTQEKEAPAGGGRPPYVLPVTLAQVERADFVARLTLSGSVRSRRTAQISFETEGRIAELAVRRDLVAALLEHEQPPVRRELHRVRRPQRVGDLDDLEVAAQVQPDVGVPRDEVVEDRDPGGAEVVDPQRAQQCDPVTPHATDVNPDECP